MRIFDVAEVYDKLTAVAPTIEELEETIEDMNDDDYEFKEQKDLDFIADEDESNESNDNISLFNNSL